MSTNAEVRNMILATQKAAEKLLAVIKDNNQEFDPAKLGHEEAAQLKAFNAKMKVMDNIRNSPAVNPKSHPALVEGGKKKD